jgi:undecaprenyl phosphate-alpha-L-ara4N flippase subunit ArnE
MLRLVAYVTIQCLFAVSGQVFLKLAMMRMDKFSFTWQFFRDAMHNWHLAASGAAMIVATLLWFYVLKHYEFSVVYPLLSISYIFMILASIFIFHETISATRWVGIVLIMAGVFLVTK